MNEKKGKGFLVIGMIASVVSVIFGIFLLQQFSTFNGGYTEFGYGGNFYTYIYQRLVDVGNMLEHILQVMVYGFSFLLITIGTIMFCYFGYKIATFENGTNMIIKEIEKEDINELDESDVPVSNTPVPEIEENTVADSSIKNTRRMTETAIMLALAVALSYVTIFSLPMGGSITLFSQVPIIIIGYRYGAKWGLSTGIVYGLLQMVLQGLGNFAYVKGIVAYLILIFADYVFAFMSLGLGGAMFKKIVKNQTVALGLGAFVGSLLRFVCHFISGVTIWGEYADGWKSVWTYSAGYNGSYMAAEGAISIVAVVLLSLVLDFSKENLRKTPNK